jgi:hypothetical protein
MTLSLVFIPRLFQFHFFFRLSNFFDLSITEKTWVVEMRIWCIKIVNVLVLHIKNRWQLHPTIFIGFQKENNTPQGVSISF